MEKGKNTQDSRWIGWMLLILLTAVFLYLFALTEIPPGLTHDEADHGITAWSIVHTGTREIYFTVGYGREPFYDYAVAGLMTFLGPTYLAGRLTAVFFGLITLAGMAAWVRRGFGTTTALLTAAGIVVAFWPLMSARQMLRSVTLPALFVLALLFFWEGLRRVAGGNVDKRQAGLVWPFLVAGLLLGLTFYTYIPARGLWLLFPLLLVYLGMGQRALRHTQHAPLLPKLWWRVGLMLLVMFVVAAPLLLYLQANPTSELRIQELAVPLTALLRGDFAPLLHNVGDGLRLFILEGDSSWRYNIAERPLLGPVMGFLFLLGVVVAIWQAWACRRTLLGAAYFSALVWLLLGFAPVLVTGSEWAMTQAMGMQPVLYLFPAVALAFIGRRLAAQPSGAAKPALAKSRWWVGLVVLLFVVTGISTVRDYFVTWANHPEVRVQYEATMKSAMDYLKQDAGIATAVSTITPGEFHTPALAQMTLNPRADDLHYFDARGALLLPQADKSQMILPGFTPLAPALEPYFSKIELRDSLPLRTTDIDRPLQIYALDNAAVQADWQKRLTPKDATFDAAVTLLGYDLQTPQAAPGDEIVLVTWWQVQRPLPTAMLFTHIQDAAGAPIAQMDKLDVPGEMWQVGDMFLQVHQIQVGEETAVGTYPVAVGVYTQTDGQRLTLPDGSDILPITQIDITE